MSSPNKRRYPKVLADELLSALRDTDELGPLRSEYLARLRRQLVRYFAERGVMVDAGPWKPIHNPEPIPLEWLDRIVALDTAYGKVHAFRNGGAEDYLAADVLRAANQIAAQQPRNLAEVEELKAFLAAHDYPHLTDRSAQARLKQRAAIKFGITVRSVNRRLEKIVWDDKG